MNPSCNPVQPLPKTSVRFSEKGCKRLHSSRCLMSSGVQEVATKGPIYKEFRRWWQERSTLVHATPLTQPQESPDKNAASEGKIGNFTEITKSSYRSTTEDAAEPEPASLGQGSGPRCHQASS